MSCASGWSDPSAPSRDYKSSNSIVNVTQGNKLISRQIEDITQQIALARSRKAEAQGRLEQVKDVTRQPEHTSGLVEVLQSPVVTQLRTQYAEVARQEADFRAIYGDRHPSIVAIRAQATDLRRQIEREIARVVDGIRNDYQVAKSREAALETELTTLRSRADSQAQTDVRLNELEREAQSDRALYEAFLNRAKETGEQQSLQIAEARIASPALVPIKPERPPALLLLAAAAILGLLLGIGLVLILEQLRRTFRSAEEVEQTLGVRTLGVLPEQVAGGNADLKQAVRHVIDRPTSDYAGSLWSLMTRLQRHPVAARPRGPGGPLGGSERGQIDAGLESRARLCGVRPEDPADRRRLLRDVGDQRLRAEPARPQRGAGRSRQALQRAGAGCAERPVRPRGARAVFGGARNRRQRPACCASCASSSS